MGEKKMVAFGTDVTFLATLTWTSVNFIYESWTEVSSPFLVISEVLSTIQIENEVVNNKVFKPQVLKKGV